MKKQSSATVSIRSSRASVTQLLLPGVLCCCLFYSTVSAQHHSTTGSTTGSATGVTGQISASLSERHHTPTVSALSSLAGGRQQLIDSLLELRLSEAPMVGIRAAELLMELSDDQSVADALREDMQSEQRLGLARLYTLRVAKISDPATRRMVTREAFERADREPAFASTARQLTDSPDQVVAETARQMSRN